MTKVPEEAPTPTPAAAPIRLPAALGMVDKLRRYPPGALFGLSLAAAVHLFSPSLRPKGWLEAPFAVSCVVLGVALQALLHWGVGWWVDPTLEDLRLSREAQLKLAKLEHYAEAGMISQEDARRLRDKIAKHDVAGDPKPRRSRSSYRKRAKDPAPDQGSPNAA